MLLDRSAEQIIINLTKRIRSLEAQEGSSAVLPCAFADLPVAGYSGRLRFVTDGRKVGELAGAGTGVLAYDDATAWRRTGDDTTVAV